MEDGSFATDSDLISSEIQVFLDMSGMLFTCCAFHITGLRNFINKIQSREP